MCDALLRIESDWEGLRGSLLLLLVCSSSRVPAQTPGQMSSFRLLFKDSVSYAKFYSNISRCQLKLSLVCEGLRRPL